MIATEQRCKDLCRKIVMFKGECEACGVTFGTEQHHGIFKSSQRYKLNPDTWYDPDLQFELCDKCHKYNLSAPHVNNNAFLQFIEKKTPDKAAKIFILTTGPLTNIDPRCMDWESVYKQLEEKFNQLTGV